MKKIAYISICALLITTLFTGCGNKNKNNMSSTVSDMKDKVSSTVSRVESGVSSMANSMMP